MLGFVPATRFDATPNLEMRFPPLPRTVHVVSELLAAEGPGFPDLHRLADTIARDPLSAISILRRINANYLGLRRRPIDVRKAVLMLGFLDVANIILTDGMLRLRAITRTEEQVRIYEETARMSLATAIIARLLAGEVKAPHPDMVYTTGLLHATGRFILLYNKPNDYEALWWTEEQGAAPSREAERAIFGIDHASLGAIACDHWYFPPEMISVISAGDQPGELDDPATRLQGLCVTVATELTRQIIFHQRQSGAGVSLSRNLSRLASEGHTSVERLVRIVLDAETRVTDEMADVLEG